MSQRPSGRGLRRSFSPWLLLLLLPYPALMWVPFYNSAAPAFFGFPFFYTYQIAWVVITAVVTMFVYLVTR